MRIYTKAEYEQKKEKIIKQIQDGAIFIYPTDTIYGIGCDATNSKAVKKIREIKGNFQRPFSVMVPDKEWIVENCDIIMEEDWLNKLPGPYTLIMNLNKMDCVSNDVHDGDTLGVRIPAHWCTDLSKLSQLPIITTSANLSGGMFMTSFETLNDEVKKHIDFMIDIGEIIGKPSTIVNLTGEETKIIQR